MGPLVKKIKERNQAHFQVQRYQVLLFRNPFIGNSKQSSAMIVGELTVAAILLEYFRCRLRKLHEYTEVYLCIFY